MTSMTQHKNLLVWGSQDVWLLTGWWFLIVVKHYGILHSKINTLLRHQPTCSVASRFRFQSLVLDETGRNIRRHLEVLSESISITMKIYNTENDLWVNNWWAYNPISDKFFCYLLEFLCVIYTFFREYKWNM